MALPASEKIKLRTTFSGLKNKVLAACAEAITETCEEIYVGAYRGTPIDTGNLQRSLMINTPEYTVRFGDNEVYGEVHYGEPGNVGGWENTEAYTYMWNPGPNEGNWHGEILYDPWNKYSYKVIDRIRENIKAKL